MSKKWWETAVFYEVYVPSFCDLNGDGMGDIDGVISKLDHLVSLGVDALWLTPFYKSPKVDNGYDVEDYFSVDPDYGTMEKMEELIKSAHSKGMRVIADMVLNHTSDKCVWFKESKKSKDNPYRDWFIWKNQPNNWQSFFGGTAWEKDDDTDMYYYHAFAKEQVDLNWTNPEVVKAMKDVLGFWLDKGMDGFRLDVINFLKVSDSFEDNPVLDDEIKHTNEFNQDGIHETIRGISKYVKSYGDKVLVGEIGSDDLEIINSYAGPGLLDMNFNFNLGSIEKYDPDRMFNELKKMHGNGIKPTLFFSSHDMPRHISRFGDKDILDRAKVIATLMLTAYGTPFIYSGEEFGLKNWVLDSVLEARDVAGTKAYYEALAKGESEEKALAILNDKSRDGSRKLINWEKPESVSNELLPHYKSMISIRRQYKALTCGEYISLEKEGEVIFYIRRYENQEIAVVINFSSKDAALPEQLKSGYEVIYSEGCDNVLTGYESRILLRRV